MTFEKIGLQAMLDSSDPFIWLQGWYYAMCDGYWEHQHGISVNNVDNPGWSLKIDLTDTGLEEYSFGWTITERSEHDWVGCAADQHKFSGACGPLNLSELVNKFREWAEPHL